MKETRAAVVVNPASGNGSTGKRWPEIARVIEKGGINFDCTLTEGPGDATAITRTFLEKGHDLILSVGGDGTLNEVVNGFFYNGELVRKQAAVGLISTGTGRDLGRTMGIPGEPAAAVRHLIESPLRPVDVGKVTYMHNGGHEDTRYFINVAGMGLDGDTAARVNRTSKALGGFISFLWGTMASLALYRNQRMTVTIDDSLVCDEPITVIVIGNGCYFGGGMYVAPNARLDDGLFDIVILRNLSKLNLLVNLPRVYRGSHLSHPRVTSLRGKKVTVWSNGSSLLNLDGEQPGRAPAVFEVQSRALKFKG